MMDKETDMKLTLRKANAVQANINEALKSLQLETQVTLNEFEGVVSQIDAVRERFFANNNARKELVFALYEIRSKVAQANAEAGINDMLTNVAYLEKEISHNNSMAAKGEQTSLKVLNGQVQKNVGSKDDPYGYSRRDAVTSIFTKEEIAEFRKVASDSKRIKQRLQDELLALNIKTEIALSENTALLLTKENIL